MKAKSREIEVNNTADANALRNVLTDYEKHLNAGDLNSWIALWTEDGRQMPPEVETRIGKAAIYTESKPVFETYNLKIEITSVEDVYVYGDLGFTRCSYNFYVKPKAGGDRIAFEPDGKALTIYKQQDDGSWKIWFDCFNSNLPTSAQ